jgi:hypothetical protein
MQTIAIAIDGTEQVRALRKLSEPRECGDLTATLPVSGLGEEGYKHRIAGTKKRGYATAADTSRR